MNSKQKELRKWRAENGLTREGYVKRYTPVLFPCLPMGVAFSIHPFFDGIPHVILRENHNHLDELRKIEEEIANLIKEETGVLESHKYGANIGVNLGLSVVDGGSHADKSKGVSGSIHFANFVKSRPDLRRRLYCLFQTILSESFGQEAWYKRLLHLTTKLNFDSGEIRTIPGLPISAFWLTQQPRDEAVHCDRNVVGSTFLLTTKSVQGAAVCMCSPSGKFSTHQLQLGQILAGQWANFAHCNLKVTNKDCETRTSWTIYLDRRVFSERYLYVEPKGFVGDCIREAQTWFAYCLLHVE